MNPLDITRAAIGNTFRSKARTGITGTAIVIGVSCYPVLPVVVAFCDGGAGCETIFVPSALSRT